MTYRKRYSLLIFIDSCIVFTSIFLSHILLNTNLQVITASLIVSSITLLISHHFFAYLYNLYKKAWEYASIGELLVILKSVTLAFVPTILVQLITSHNILIRLLVVTWMLHTILIGGSRLCWRLYRNFRYPKKDVRKRTLIVGAGSAGTMVARQLLNNLDGELLPVAFIDDNSKKHHLDVMGIPVVGGISCISHIVEKLNIENIIIAIPSLGKKELNLIFQECLKTEAKTQILPMLEDIVTGRISVSQFRDVQVEDLLGREPVELDIAGISEYITDRIVLVSGAGGSIGSEICRQVMKFNPRALILLGHGENSIYTIEMELRDTYGQISGVQIITEIADIQDEKKMNDIMQTYCPDVVYHAAAHKHVPLMERNPEEAVKNNLLGTINIAKAAQRFAVHTFVMISTDKAVNPTSVMGATKRLAEMFIQKLGKTSKTRFVAVRFGNVLGSRGSVIPRFKQQIEAGGPVTVTDPEMERYFMTIPEASRLVVQAGALAKGGEIFVLDMGEPVKIVDLARNLIRLSGYSIEDIEIKFTGARPGEKLYEELLKPEEVHEQQIYSKIYIGKTANILDIEIEDLINNYMKYDREQLRTLLIELANYRIKISKDLATISV